MSPDVNHNTGTVIGESEYNSNSYRTVNLRSSPLVGSGLTILEHAMRNMILLVILLAASILVSSMYVTCQSIVSSVVKGLL